MPNFDPTTGLPVLAPPGGNPLQRSLVNGAAPFPASAPAPQPLPLTTDQLQAIFNKMPPLVAPSPQPAAATPAPTPAATTPAAAKPPAQPVAAPGAVSPTPGVGNPLPPNLRTADTGGVPLPQGGLPTLQGTDPNQGVAVLEGNRPVTYGGGAMPTYANAPAQMMNPEGVINRGFDLQTQRTENFMNQALDYINQGSNIFDRATRGRAIASILAATAGPNNVGQVQGQGADSTNNALAGIQQASLGANASMYGSTLGLAGNEQRVGEAHYEASTGSEPIGTDIVQTQFGPMPVTRYGTRAGGMAPNPITPTPTNNSALRVGATYKGGDGTYNAPGGRKVTVKNGQITSIE